MADSKQGRDDGTPSPPGSDDSGIGLKFNQVGREDYAREVLTPKVDAAVRRRTYLIVGLAVLAFVLLILVSINRFGVETSGGGANPDRAFDRPEPNIP